MTKADTQRDITSSSSEIKILIIKEPVVGRNRFFYLEDFMKDHYKKIIAYSS